MAQGALVEGVVKIENAKALLDGNTKCYRRSRAAWLAIVVGMFGLWTLLRGLSDGVWALDREAAIGALAAYALILVHDLTDEVRSAKSIIAEFLPGGRQGPGVG